MKEFKSICFVFLKFPVSNLVSASGLECLQILSKTPVVNRAICGLEMRAVAHRWLKVARRWHKVAHFGRALAHRGTPKCPPKPHLCL
jgi:hypothetical protein